MEIRDCIHKLGVAIIEDLLTDQNACHSIKTGGVFSRKQEVSPALPVSSFNRASSPVTRPVNSSASVISLATNRCP